MIWSMRVKSSLIVSISIAVWCAPAYAQSNTNPDQPSMAETSKEFDRLLRVSDQLHRSTLSAPRASTSISPVLRAIPEFRKATADLREAVGNSQGMRAPLQSIEKLIKPFTEYFKELNLKSPVPDIQELKTYSPKDLVWETLTTAERVDNNLQIANRLLRESNQSGAVTVKTLQFYGEIDSDLKRLKWLAGKVAAQR